MNEFQKDLGYNGFISEIKALETKIHDFGQSLSLEADNHYWKHISILLEEIKKFNTPFFLNAETWEKRTIFREFLTSINAFERTIEKKKSSLEKFKRFPYRYEDRIQRLSEILYQVIKWEMIANQISYTYIYKF